MLCSKPPEIFRINEAAKHMNNGDPEPPFLPSLNVLKNTKCAYLKKQYLHEDQRSALEKMQEISMGNIIHDNGLKPFRVLFWSNDQNHIYINYVKNNDSEVAIDASPNDEKNFI